MAMSQSDYIAAAKQVIDTEIKGLQQLSQYLDDNFLRACSLLLDNPVGKVAVMGIGKSGHIGNKIAATLASTGTPAFFVHPSEAAHGDMGMIDKHDIVIAISYSGESSEILPLYSLLKRRGITIISMTGNPQSNMAKLSDVHLQVSVPEEACPLGLAPTSSAIATLAMGDALAITLLQARGFTKEDFALSHPGGALGRKLLLKLEDIMHSGDELPRVAPDALIRDALLEISQKGLGMTAVVDQHNSLVGIFTDGDLRRILDKRVDIHSAKISEVMTRQPTVANASMLAVEGLNLMQDKRINGLMIVENNTLVGALNMHDLLKAGVM